MSGTLIQATDPDQAKTVIAQDIAYIDCDPASYPGNLNGLSSLSLVQGNQARAVIFYTTSAATCNYTQGNTPPSNPFIYAMTTQSDSTNLYNEITQPGNNGFTPSTAIITQTEDGQNNTNGNQNSGSNPLGPSPSTAVAMIILYSITGVITALFLIIIVTGAIRAHRHPERYGPRNGAGRPRQSRAKGLARAMLETLPIVKFEERQTDKSPDVELGPASRDNVTTEQAPHVDSTGDQRGSEAKSPEQANAEASQIATGHQEGHSLTDAATDVPTNANPAGGERDGLGCSICTEDFERGQDIRVLPCDHKFHPACIDPWLLNVSGTCPLCRVDLRPRTSHSSLPDADEVSRSGSFAPPLAETDEADGVAGSRATRRISMLRNVLHMRTAEERAAALRELREQQEEGERQEVGANNDVVRRRNRLTARLQDVFRVRTRRGANAGPEEQSSGRVEARSPVPTASESQ